MKGQAVLPEDATIEKVRNAARELGEEVEPREADLAINLLHRCAETKGTVDYDDQLWLPVVSGASFPRFDYTYVDESQDLNPIQHRMLVAIRKGGGRVFVIGDPFQAIYAFRGADAKSMETLRSTLGITTQFPLTASRRCPYSHVMLARKIVKDFEAAHDAKDGVVIRDSSLGLAKPGDLVICRMNAPMVSECIKKISQGVSARVLGRDIGEGLARLFRKLVKTYDSLPKLLSGIQTWANDEEERLIREDQPERVEPMRDRALGLSTVARAAGSLEEIIPMIDKLFSDQIDVSSRITYNSIHRAKGSESRTVFFCDIPYSRKYVPSPTELTQRGNLRYVALTRSLDTLHIVEER